MKKLITMACVIAMAALSLPVVGCGGNSNVKEYKKCMAELTKLAKKAGEDISELGAPSAKEFAELSESEQAAVIGALKVSIAEAKEELGTK